MAYLNIPYQGSELHKGTLSATDASQLENRKRYTLYAIDFHTKAGNAGQVEIFKQDLALINKRLKKFTKP